MERPPLNDGCAAGGIGLRAYGQRDPVVEYQREGYRMFQDMIGSIKAESLTMLLRVQPVAQAQPVSVFETTPQQEVHPEAPALSAALSEGPVAAQAPPPQPRTSVQPTGPKVGRNEPCPCGSGKKYKKCHGQ